MKKNRLKIIAIFIGIIGVLVLFSGVSFSLFSYQKLGLNFSGMKTDSIIFNYKEGTDKISLKDAMPMTDIEGITQDNYFEFKISANSFENIELPYSITAKKSNNSSNIDEAIKIGLTELVPAYKQVIPFLEVDEYVCNNYSTATNTTNEIEYGCNLKYKAGDSTANIYALTYYYDLPYDTLEMCQNEATRIAGNGMASFGKCEEKEGKYYVKLYVGDYSSESQCISSQFYENGDECILKYADKESFDKDIYELSITFNYQYSYSTCSADIALVDEYETGSVKIKNDRAKCIKTDKFTEEPILVDTYNNFINYNIDNSIEKTIYNSAANYKNYNKTYRLRMWIDENTNMLDPKYQNASFRININVYAKGDIFDLPGLYDANNRLLVSWDDLINKYGLDVEQDYAVDDYMAPDYSFFDTEEKINDYLANPHKYTNYKKETILGYIMQHNEELSNGYKLIMGNVEKIGSYSLACIPIREVVIPSTVINIGTGAFGNDSYLTNVKFKSASKLSKIGTQAFIGTSIEGIVIPASVKYIGNYAFSSCQNLKTVTFEKNSRLKTIQKGAFASSGLESIEIPSSVEVIGAQAFRLCNDLKTVTFGKNSNLTVIQQDTFASSGLESIEILSSVETIGAWAFNNCQNLKTVTFEKNSRLKTIEKNAFLNSSLESIEILSSVETIGAWAFSSCQNLKTVTFEKNSRLKTIETNAFVASGLESIEIPSSVETIGAWAFNQCNDLKMVTFEKNSRLTAIQKATFASSGLESIEIPSSVEVIGESAFNCHNLKTVTFEKNSHLIEIGYIAFIASGLESIEIPSSVETIGAWAFNQCNDLKMVTFEKNSRLKTIEENAFVLTGLNTITIPSTVKNIGENAFSNIPHVYYTGNATGSPWGAKAIN